MDSVKFLWSIPPEKKIDFLYLDSYDIERENPHPSQMHHVKEMCVSKNLKKGTIVVVDDHDASLLIIKSVKVTMLQSS